MSSGISFYYQLHKLCMFLVGFVKEAIHEQRGAPAAAQQRGALGTAATVGSTQEPDLAVHTRWQRLDLLNWICFSLACRPLPRAGLHPRLAACLAFPFSQKAAPSWLLAGQAATTDWLGKVKSPGTVMSPPSAVLGLTGSTSGPKPGSILSHPWTQDP